MSQGRRYVWIPTVGRIRLGDLVSAVYEAKILPDTTFRCGLTSERPTKGREVLAQFREGMHDRINAAVPYVERDATSGGRRARGRKDCSDWDRETRQLAQRVNTPRLIVRESQVPMEFRERLSHRLTRSEDGW